MSTANSWIHLPSQDKRYALPDTLRERDPMNARDCGWVDQMMPFVKAHGRHDAWLIDPFCGFGSTLVAAHLADVRAVGVERSPERSQLAIERLAQLGASDERCAVVTGNLADAATRSAVTLMPDGVARRPFNLCLTNIPYFGCSGVPEVPNTGADAGQLYLEAYYEPYLQGLRDVFVGVHGLLEPGGWCIVMAQNLQLGETFVPLAWDVARLLAERFTLHEERILVYDRPGVEACLPGLKSNRAHEYALICQKRVRPLAVETGKALLARLKSAGFTFAVYGSFARCLQDEGAAAPGDIDLLVPPDDAQVSRLMRWLDGEGFCVESWNAPVKPPVATAVLAHRYYFRARRLHRSGEVVQIDIAVAADRPSFDAHVVP